MAEPVRLPGRHPLCTCPEITWSGPAPDRSQCAGGTTAHPVMTADDIKELRRAR